MKVLIKLIMLVATLAFAFVAMIKIVQNCSWKEAVGITEELFKEI